MKRTNHEMPDYLLMPVDLLYHGKRRQIRTYAALRMLAEPETWTVVTLAQVADKLGTRSTDASLQLKLLEQDGYIKSRVTHTDTQSYVKEYYIDR